MITRQRHVFYLACAVTIFAVAFVCGLVMLTYPREDWPWELSFSIGVASVLAFPLAYGMGYLVFRNAQLNAELRRLLERDRLTDLASRDHFFDRLAADPQASGVVLVVDIDHFKRVNDTYGHLPGDAVIRQVAAVLRARSAPRDVVCRYGGEEFVLFLDGRGRDEAARFAETIRAEIAETIIEDEGAQISVTVSIGGSPKEGMRSIEAAIREADTALYHAKATGRNRAVMSWLPEQGQSGAPQVSSGQTTG